MSRPAFAIFAQHYLSTLLSNFGQVYCNTPVPRDPKLRICKSPSRLNWSTEFLRAATAGNETIMVNPEVTGEAELVDVLFEPDPRKSRTSLGLLGELLFVPVIIEPLRWSPTEWELRTCLGHWLTWKTEADGTIVPVDEIPVYEEKDDDDRDDYKEEIVDKILLIVVPSIQSKFLMGFGANPSTRNIPGVYDLPPAFCTTIVVTSELPKTEHTLWLRLLGRGPTQRSAIQDLMNLEFDHLHRKLALQQLQQWYQLLLGGQMGKESRHLIQLLSCINN
jgi:hypothetical protein